MNCWFIRKGESWCRGILLDIRTRIRDAECTHKETNDRRGDGRRKSVCICSAEWNMSDHTRTNATDSIRTPQVKGAWARVVLGWVTSCEVFIFHPFSWEVLVLHPFFCRWFFRRYAWLELWFADLFANVSHGAVTFYLIYEREREVQCARTRKQMTGGGRKEKECMYLQRKIKQVRLYQH